MEKECWDGERALGWRKSVGMEKECWDGVG